MEFGRILSIWTETFFQTSRGFHLVSVVRVFSLRAFGNRHCDTSKRRFAARRLRLVYRTLVAVGSSPNDSISAMKQLVQVLVPGSSALRLPECLPALELALQPFTAILDEAADAPGATATSVAAEVLKGRDESRSTRPSAPSADEDTPRGPADIDSRALETALATPVFRGISDAIRNCDTQTSRGKLDAIAAAFNGQCVITVRALCSKRSMLTRNETILTLTDLRSALPEYFTWLLVADDDGNIPDRLSKYSFVGGLQSNGSPAAQGTEFLDAVLNFEFASADWTHAPGGLCALKAVNDGLAGIYSKLNTEDRFTIPAVVEELGAFIHAILVGMGAAATVEGDPSTVGVTFAGWNELYLVHLKTTSSYPADQRFAHLEHCHALYLLSLRVVGRRFKEAVFSQLPADKRFDGGLLFYDEPPISDLLRRDKARKQMADLRFQLEGSLSDSFKLVSGSGKGGPSVTVFDFPLRSQNPANKSGSSSHGQGGANGGSQPKAKGKGKLKPPTNADAVGIKPGSLVPSWMWIGGEGKELLIAGLVWKIPALAKKLGVTAKAKCWPFLLCRNLALSYGFLSGAIKSRSIFKS